MKALLWAIVIMMLVGGGVSGIPSADAGPCDRYPERCR